MRNCGYLLIFLLVRATDMSAAKAAIKVDQAGYLPNTPKLAMVTASTGVHAFTLRKMGDNSIVLQGSLAGPVADADSGDSVFTADFTKVTTPGRYFLEIPGLGRSWNFAIGEDAFRRAYYLAARSFYGQRCGTAVDLGAEFSQFKHDACHLSGEYNASSGKTGTHLSSHGWHDAGDYGRYLPSSGISTATLLWAYEMYGAKVNKVGLKLPESGNGTPDLLNEARWNIEWMMTMQDTDGGVWHKQTSTHFSGFIMPGKDALPSDVIGTGSTPYKSSCATGDFAAVLAIAARVYRPFDPAFAQRALMAAESGWQWLGQNPNVTFHNPPGVATGEYGDSHCSDERLWAAGELSRTTGKDMYSQFFVSQYRDYLSAIKAVGPPSWESVAPLGLWTYVLGGGKDGSAVQTIRDQSIRVADEILARAGQNGYRTTMTTADYIWGSNGVAANYGMQLLVANAFSPNQRFVQAATDNLHYLLGRNTFSLSWVTQLGENAFLHPHHRPSVADGVDLPWPGLLSGGPNKDRQDPISKKMSPDTPPAQSYVDESGAYAVNEVAINWNAPLVFVLAALLPE